jgi:hypothetical protein
VLAVPRSRRWTCDERERRRREEGRNEGRRRRGQVERHSRQYEGMRRDELVLRSSSVILMLVVQS